MGAEKDYLLDYLREEFHRYPQIRVRVVPHSEAKGVMVRTEAREYFFPFEWARVDCFHLVEAEVKRILELE